MKKTPRLQKGLDVEVICGEDDLEKHFLVDSDELLVPFTDVGRALACFVLILVRLCAGERLPAVVLAVLQDLTHVDDQLMLTQRLDLRLNVHLFQHAG